MVQIFSLNSCSFACNHTYDFIFFSSLTSLQSYNICIGRKWNIRLNCVCFFFIVFSLYSLSVFVTFTTMFVCIQQMSQSQTTQLSYLRIVFIFAQLRSHLSRSLSVFLLFFLLPCLDYHGWTWVYGIARCSRWFEVFVSFYMVAHHHSNGVAIVVRNSFEQIWYVIFNLFINNQSKWKLYVFK